MSRIHWSDEHGSFIEGHRVDGEFIQESRGNLAMPDPSLADQIRAAKSHNQIRVAVGYDDVQV